MVSNNLSRGERKGRRWAGERARARNATEDRETDLLGGEWRETDLLGGGMVMLQRDHAVPVAEVLQLRLAHMLR